MEFKTFMAKGESARNAKNIQKKTGHSSEKGLIMQREQTERQASSRCRGVNNSRIEIVPFLGGFLPPNISDLVSFAFGLLACVANYSTTLQLKWLSLAQRIFVF